MGCCITSVYPSEVKEYGYSSRNQQNESTYTDLLAMRLKAKHSPKNEMFSEELGLTNGEVKDALKLPLNSMTGGLRDVNNPLYDPLMGVSICLTGQMLLIQLIHDVLQVPTTELVSGNTDALMYLCDEEYEPQVEEIIHKWEKRTRLQLEEDKIIKLVMRDVNNYCEICQVKDGYEVHYKGGDLTHGEHEFKWDNNTQSFHYTFKDSLTSNSLTILSEAMLKELLFDIPCEDTIRNCNDVFRFQMITHLGSSYDKCVLVHSDGTEEELQRNNRIYAGKEKTGGKVYKVKGDKYDSLAKCPPNPIIDNSGVTTIDDIDKIYYIRLCKQQITDFLGKGEIYMRDKLEKMKKDELIDMIDDIQNSKGENNIEPINQADRVSLLKKIQKFREGIRGYNFVLDQVLPNNRGGKETFSLSQVYNAIQECCASVGLDFDVQIPECIGFAENIYKPSATSLPQHLITVVVVITLTDIDTGATKEYNMVATGSDISDKGISCATSNAVRQWLTRNFTPCVFNGEKVTVGIGIDDESIEDIKQDKPKAFIPTEKKEAIKKEVVNTVTLANTNPVVNEDVEEVTRLISEFRELSGLANAGQKTLDAIKSNSITDIELLNAKLNIQNSINDLKNKQ